MTGHLELWVLGLLAAVAGLVMLSNRLGVPYPVFLVLGGLALGLIPIVPEIGLPPDLIPATRNAPWRTSVSGGSCWAPSVRSSSGSGAKGASATR